MVPSPFALMWKRPKSIAVFAASSIGLYYLYDFSLTNDVMKVSCRRASYYGNELLSNPHANTRHITVILNPIAGKRKSKKLYNKWVEPMLHLAGIKVSLIETESPNQAYNLMKIMSNCDGVAIVGGDGTVNEALNGLLNRPDSSQAVRDFPIAIIPTGQYNSIARYIHQGNLDYRNQKEFLIHATIRLVDSVTTKFDVLKITPTDEELKAKESPIFALRDLRYGIYQDNFYKVSGYAFYQNYIKPYWFRLQRALRRDRYKVPQIESISYTLPCEGCTRCHERHRLPESTKEEDKSVNRRWWSSIAPISKPKSELSEEYKREMELAKRDNPDCGKWKELGGEKNVTDFKACMMGDKKVRLSIGQFREYNPSEVIETQDVKLKVVPELDESKKQTTSQNSTESDNKDEEKKTVNFLIDGQTNRAHSVEITALSKAVTVFTGPQKPLYTIKRETAALAGR